MEKLFISPHSRESTKKDFEEKFGRMLEEADVKKMLGKEEDLDKIMSQGEIIVVWPGDNRPVFPAFQFVKGNLYPKMNLILETIYLSSNQAFRSPRRTCEWFLKPIDGYKRIRPLDLMQKGKDEELISEAEKFGRNLASRTFRLQF